AQLPSQAKRHPDIWYVQGLWAEKNGQFEAAARCYWEAIRIEPDQRRANFQIAGVLNTLGRTEIAKPFAKRDELLMELHSLLFATNINTVKKIASDHAPRIAQLTEALGRYWEAWAWNYVLAQQGDAKAAAAQDRLKNLLMQKKLPQTADASNPAL